MLVPLLLACAPQLTTAAPDPAVPLALPARPPARLTVEVVRDGRPRVLELERHDLRAPDARLLLWDGDYRSAPLPPVRTYRGRVRGEASTVLAGLHAHGLVAHVLAQDGADWRVEPLPDEPGVLSARRLHVARDWRRDEFVDCGGALVPPFGAPPAGRRPAPQTGFACSLDRAQIAWDADFEYVQARGGVGATVAQIEDHLNLVDFFFARDVLITLQSSGYVLRTAPFYTPTTGGELLDQFRLEWEANVPLERDLAHLMTAKPGGLIQYGGLAWVGVVCSSHAYGWSLDSAGIVGHEVGHNWAAGHCHDLSPCNNMCGACLNVQPNTKRIIEAHRDSRTCLTRVEPYATPAPPYAHPDHLELERESLAAAPYLIVDVLANDHDANCDPLVIVGHDARSEYGARVAVHAAFRDQLVVRPDHAFAGVDTIRYRVADGTGFETEGVLTIEVHAPGLVGHWRLDDAAGVTAADAANHGDPGRVQGTAGWTAGAPTPGGGGLAFAASTDHVALTQGPELSFGERGDFTLSLWVKSNGWSGTPVFLSNKDWSSGDNVGWLIGGNADGSTWRWNYRGAGGARYDWTGGGVIADGQWHHLAVGHERGQFVRFFQDGVNVGGLGTPDDGRVDTPLAVGIGQDGTLTWGDAATITVDDVQLHGRRLAGGAIADLYAGSTRRAAGPFPPDGGGLDADATTLAWTPATLASSQDVYLGTDYQAVLAATPASPELVGSTTGGTLAIGGLVPGAVYYWRVATVGAASYAGDVWSFRALGPLNDGLLGYWKLDETGGATAASEVGTNLNGTLVGLGGGAWQPGKLAGGLELRGGADGYVDVGRRVVLRPAGAISLAAWVRPDAFGNHDGVAGYAHDTRDVESGAFLHTRSGNAWGWGVAVEGDVMRYVTSGGGYPTGRWTHVVGTYDGRVIALWVDGARVASYVDPGTIDWDPNPSQGFEIGRWADDNEDRRLDGRVDEVAVWNRALRPEEIQRLFQSGQGSPVQ